jgi:hypothetical protein
MNQLTTVQKINDLAKLDDSKLSGFEKGFVAANAARVAKWGGNTRLFQKQTALIDRIHKERVQDGRTPGTSKE